VAVEREYFAGLRQRFNGVDYHPGDRIPNEEAEKSPNLEVLLDQGYIKERPIIRPKPKAKAAPVRDEIEGMPEVKPDGFDATDAAVSLAQDYGISLASITGSGAGGRITVGDVRDHIAEQE
jgi:pyruvate/2-oxoglutarate dehydrogenase complex dihydrolipoamide acyltransferase (E2) component